MPLNKKEIVISSDTTELKVVETFLYEIFRTYQIDEDLYLKVLVCLNEAVTNSIMHGNKFDDR